MRILEYGDRLIEIVISYPVGDDPVTLECTDLGSEMLFSIFREETGELVLRASSDRIPLDLLPMVAKIAEQDL